MNKQGLAYRLKRQFGFGNREANVIVDHFFLALTQALTGGRRIELRGLGTFGTKQRKASVGRVVKTGERVLVPALHRVYFRPGKALKEIRTRH